MAGTRVFSSGAIMILNTTRITVAPEKRKEFFQTINQMLGPLRAAAGCLSFNVYVDSCDENSSLVVGEWDTEADLNIHLHSSDFAILRGAMAVLGIRIDEYRALIYAGGKQIPDRPPLSGISL